MSERAPGLRLHPRTRPVQSAGSTIKTAILQMQESHELTDVEMLQILTEAQQIILKYMLREERHPGRTDRKADEE